MGTDKELVEVPVQGDIDLFAQIPPSGLSGEEEISTLDNELAEDLNKGKGNSINPSNLCRSTSFQFRILDLSEEEQPFT